MPSRRSLQQAPAPLRRCLICREPAPKPELLRVVRRPDGELTVSARLAGRGAYVHPHAPCLTTTLEQPRHWSRALRRPLPDSVRDQLKQLAEAAPPDHARLTTNPTC